MIESLTDEKPARKLRGDRAVATLDRLPPHSTEAEQGVLGCCLLEPSACLGECAVKLRHAAGQAFYDLRHQHIYAAMAQMYDEQIPVDFITVQDRLKKWEMLEQVGGIPYLLELEKAVPSAANLSYYLDIVREKHKLRKLIQTCSGIVGKIYDYDGPVEKLLVECEAEVSKLTEVETAQTEEHIKTVMQRVITDMELWHYSRGSQQIRGLPTGPNGIYLDKILMGIRDTHYITIAGRPGEGKSSFAMNVVEYLATDYVWQKPTGGMKSIEQTSEGGAVTTVQVAETEPVRGIPVGVFTIEMDNESLGYRLLFGRAGVSEAKFNQGFAVKGTDEKLVKASIELSRTNIWLDDSTGQTINQIAAKARRMAKQHGIKLFVLDYLQLCVSDNPRDEERIKLDKISKKIMALKKQLGVPWLVLAQLNRNIETDGRGRDRQPLLSDLAGSGAIEQDSDKVIIIRKTPRREVEEEPEGGGSSDQEMINQVMLKEEMSWDEKPIRMDLFVVKNRRGPRGHAKYVFQSNLCRFEDFHLWKVKHGLEERKAGESKHFGAQASEMPSDDELGMGK